LLERLADLLAAGDLAHAVVARVVLEDHDVACEEWPVRARKVHEHAVVPGDRHDAHRGHPGRAVHFGARRGDDLALQALSFTLRAVARGAASSCEPSFSMSAASSSISPAFSSESGGRTGPAPWPTIVAPAFTMLT